MTTDAPTTNPHSDLSHALPGDPTPPTPTPFVNLLRASIESLYGPCSCPKCVAKRSAPIPTNDAEAAAWAQQATTPVPPAERGRSEAAPVGPSKGDALLAAYVRAKAVGDSAVRAAADATRLGLRLVRESLLAGDSFGAEAFAGADAAETVRYVTPGDNSAVYRVTRVAADAYQVDLLGTNAAK